MDIDENRVGDAVLALLLLGLHDGRRAQTLRLKGVGRRVHETHTGIGENQRRSAVKASFMT